MVIADGSWDDASFRAGVDATLTLFLDEQAQGLLPLGPDAVRLIDEARTAVAGGKRFRAAFCHWGFRAVRPTLSEADDAALLRACGALELLHASALAHDDLMDASDTRRGRPSSHRALEGEHRTAGWRGDPGQYGAAGAILLGDLMQGWADELLRRCGLGWETVGPALEVFDLCRTEVIAGQFLDVSVQARGRADLDTAMTVLRYKSAKYSIERPLHVGAALAGGGGDVRVALTAFGLPLGEAFQLRDDLLGVYGDPATTGKPAGDDLVEGKRTVLVAHALDALRDGPASDAAAADLLDRSLGTPLTVDDVDRLREVIDASGAHARVETTIAQLCDVAVSALEDAVASGLVDDRAGAVLHGLADAVTQRVV
ncbi:polyprenyl synthetase family protein [Nocardioides sp. C4-1]|uniref:polyprenyl synthetase family protein n=1 Tax=Nocardioides sp. C4-1 TaxID=3151851 RepID=UPI003267557B